MSRPHNFKVLPVKDIVRAYLADNKCVSRLAKKYGVSVFTIRDRLHREGVPVPKHNPLRGPANPRWSGGVKRKPQYVRVRVPGHPRCCPTDPRVFEHIVVAEKALGRYLERRHVIHHVNGKQWDNTPSNLVICESVAYHHLLHKRMRLKAKGKL